MPAGIMKGFKINANVPIVAAIFLSISIQSFLANASQTTNLHFTRGVIILSDIYILLVWLLAVTGAINKNIALSMITLILWSIFIGIWIAMVAISMFSKGENYMCTYGRCPESIWLYNNSLHLRDNSKDGKYDYELDRNYVIKPVEPKDEIDDLSINPSLEDQFDMRSLIPSSSEYPELEENDFRDYQNNGPDKKKPAFSVQHVHQKFSKFRWNVLVLIVILIVVFGILIFGWAILFSNLLDMRRVAAKCPVKKVQRDTSDQEYFLKYCPKQTNDCDV